MPNNNRVIKTFVYLSITFVLIIFELCAYKFNFFHSLNLFFILFAWSYFIYWALGLTQLENKFIAEYPIKFKISIFYVLKLIIRRIKVKYLVLKYLINEIKIKRLWIREFILVILVILISCMIVRYLRGALIVEIIHVLNLDKEMVNLLTMLSLFIVDSVMRIINQVNEYEFLYLIESPREWTREKKKWMLDQVKESITFHMKKAFQKISKELPKIYEVTSEGIIHPETKIVELKNTTITIDNKFKIPKFIISNNGKEAVQIQDRNKVNDTITGFKVFSYINLEILERFNSIQNHEKQYQFLLKNMSEIHQAYRLSWIISNKNQNYIILKKLHVESPYDLKTALITIKEFERKILENNTINRVHAHHYRLTENNKNNFQSYENKNRIFKNQALYEIPLLPGLLTFFNKYNIVGIPPNFIQGEPDAFLYNKNVCKSVQLKCTTDFNNINKLQFELNETKKYEETVVSAICIDNSLLITEKQKNNQIMYGSIHNINTLDNAKTNSRLTSKNIFQIHTEMQRLIQLENIKKQQIINPNNTNVIDPAIAEKHENCMDEYKKKVGNNHNNSVKPSNIKKQK